MSDEREHEENIVEALAMFIEFCNTSEGAVVERAKASAHTLAAELAACRAVLTQHEGEIARLTARGGPMSDERLAEAFKIVRERMVWGAVERDHITSEGALAAIEAELSRLAAALNGLVEAHARKEAALREIMRLGATDSPLAFKVTLDVARAALLSPSERGSGGQT